MPSLQQYLYSSMIIRIHPGVLGILVVETSVFCESLLMGVFHTLQCSSTSLTAFPAKIATNATLNLQLKVRLNQPCTLVKRSNSLKRYHEFFKATTYSSVSY